ncbi:MAG: N-acetyl-gamma-glutamyl-phosphate reductase, partial [Phycisphaerales bacterium]
DVVCATSRREDRPALGEVHPSLAGRSDLVVESLGATEVAERCDAALCCLPHAASAEAVRDLVEGGVRVVDLSADFRLRDLATYERWYDTTHPAPGLLEGAAYGMPEFFAGAIREASVVANPGCYPTSALLALRPLAVDGLLDPGAAVIVDAKSGVTGAGRNASDATHFPETNENFKAYKVGAHRHQPEIRQGLSKAMADDGPPVLFTPHLVPMNRGILATCYATLRASISQDDLLARLARAHEANPFVRVGERLPETKHVAGTNFADISARVDGRTAIVICAIDNLLKGASGTAVQNLNIMFGLDEAAALR